MRPGWVYIVASKHWTLYTGVTGALEQRIWQHKTKAFKGFSSKYNCDRLVFFEQFEYIGNAIAREKEIKGWTRAKKLALIQKTNPGLEDLAAEFFPQEAIDEARKMNQTAMANPSDPPEEFAPENRGPSPADSQDSSHRSG